MMLTKSYYMNGLQCSKLLWYSVNDKSAFPPISSSQQHLFDEGTYVGELARKLYSEGIDCSGKDIKKTLSHKKPLFEVGIGFKDLYARADILVPSIDGWDIVEVKSSTSVKDEHVADVSFQKYVFTNAGIPINDCYIMHINNEYVRNGEIDVEGLFVKERVDVISVEDKISEMLKIVKLERYPTIDIGPYCDDPYTCPLHDMCWKDAPSVLEIGGKKGWELYNDGVRLLKDVPTLSAKINIQVEAAKTGKIRMDGRVISAFMSKLVYPLHYFDFETVNSAVPLYDGVRPYQQIPFQYSLHVSDKHYSYLSFEGDPRLGLLEALKRDISDTGSIVAYNAAFEKTRLKEMAEAFPQYSTWISELLPRFVDLWDVFRKFDCYSPSQHGSASLKKVLPAFTGKDYSDFKIANGSDASLAYLSVVKGLISSESVRSDMEKYCGQDTEGMVWIMERLEKEISK